MSSFKIHIEVNKKLYERWTSLKDRKPLTIQ